jgi:hypothetical protein
VKLLSARPSLNSLSIIISNALTRAKAISCSSLPPSDHFRMLFASNVANALAVCSSSINVPHEYFDPTGLATLGSRGNAVSAKNVAGGLI